MKWLVFEIDNICVAASRFERENYLHYCKCNNVKDIGVVIKTYDNRNEAQEYCDKINFVNNLIDML